MSCPPVPIPLAPPEVPAPHPAENQRLRFGAAYSILERSIDQRVFPGAAFSVLVDKEIIAIDGVGRLTYEPSAAAAGRATIYDLASITKVLATTSMAMLLYERGRLPLDRPIVDWLPAFAGGERPGSQRYRVTPRMLLAHSSGLPGYVRLFETYPDGDALFEACLRLPLTAEPGARAEYSDMGFILLGRVLETIAGEPLDIFCRREIFAPLGMNSTCFRPPPSWTRSIAPTEEDLTFRHRIIQGEVQDENCFVLGGVSGHAGVFSNAMDPLALCAMPVERRRRTLSSADDPTVHHPLGSSPGKLTRIRLGHTFPSLFFGPLLQPALRRTSGLCGHFIVDRLRAPDRHPAAHQPDLAASRERGHPPSPSRLSRRYRRSDLTLISGFCEIPRLWNPTSDAKGASNPKSKRMSRIFLRTWLCHRRHS